MVLPAGPKTRARPKTETIVITLWQWPITAEVSRPVILEILEAASEDMDVEPTVEAPAATADTVGSPASDLKPSDYIIDELWVATAVETFKAMFQGVDEEVKELADKLWAHLLANLESHLTRKWKIARSSTSL